MLALGLAGTLIDRIAWAGSRPGVALALAPDRTDPASNDEPDAWCAAEAAYGLGDLGTPGLPNARCPTVVPAGSCLDGATVRPLVRPMLGDVAIAEVMADPAAVVDSRGEWFELLFLVDGDLNGLQLGPASLDLASGDLAASLETAIGGESCLPVAAGTRVVFARSASPEENGGLPAVAATFGFDLANAPWTARCSTS